MNRLLAFGLTVCCAASNLNADVLVTNDSEWRYLHLEDGKDPAEGDKEFHSTFMKADFDDAEWKKGKDRPGKKYGFGYGTAGSEDFEGISLAMKEPKTNDEGQSIDAPAAYFRSKFTSKEDFDTFVFKCQRDDAIIVYIDGEEVLRDNLPKGEDKIDLYASETISSDGETKVNKFPVRKKLKAGEHVLAISLHNREGSSSDLRIAEISLETVDEKELKKLKDDAEGEEADEDDLF
ncbi:hypothetical protein ACFL2H_04900 [Planctomycetota bacterium]